MVISAEVVSERLQNISGVVLAWAASLVGCAPRATEQVCVLAVHSYIFNFDVHLVAAGVEFGVLVIGSEDLCFVMVVGAIIVHINIFALIILHFGLEIFDFFIECAQAKLAAVIIMLQFCASDHDLFRTLP